MQIRFIQSKYKSDAVHILGQYYKRGDLQKLRIYADDTVHGGYYEEIVKILNNDFGSFSKSPIIPESPKSTSTINELCGPWKCKDVNANRYSCRLRYNFIAYVFICLWALHLCVAKVKFSSKKNCNFQLLNRRIELWTSLGNCGQNGTRSPGQIEINDIHETQSNRAGSCIAILWKIHLWFSRRIFFTNAIPIHGKNLTILFWYFFPFIFCNHFSQNLLELIESEVKSFDHTQALACCLKLTKNLSRRVTIQRNASMYSPSSAVSENNPIDFDL